VRIVGGELRGRRLAVPPGDVRPTGDRQREALFNVLTHKPPGGAGDAVTGAIVLDAFAGSGALGLEALSRGAVHATFLEADRRVAQALTATLADLGVADRATVLTGDAGRPPQAAQPCTLAFLDPPYRQGLAAPALAALAAQNWFAPDALIVVEQAADEELAASEGFREVDTRRTGDTLARYLRWGG